MVGADRLPQLGALQQPAGGDDRAGSEPVEASGALVEGERHELLEVRGLDASGEAEQQEAVEVAGS